MTTAISKQRDFSIDILKCLAALVITWSHFELPLGKYSALATGGSFGDCFFFFCSGYTLMLSRPANGFLNWYKRRIGRIYPTVFAWALATCLIFSSLPDFLSVITSGGGYFVSCIMIFYILFYPIMIYGKKNLTSIMLATLVITGGGYFLCNHEDVSIMYKWKWSTYFVVMIMGAIMAKRHIEDHLPKLPAVIALIALVISAGSYYLLLYFEGNDHYAFLNIFNIIPQLGVTFFTYLLCRSDLMKILYEKNVWNAVIMTIGSLCLEIYIVQHSIITDRFNNIFPLNIVLIFIAILISAYLLRCLSRIWTQTFKDADYNWKAVLKPW